jgi:hypothetical protein
MAILLFWLFLVLADTGLAGSSQNVSGFAWSETIGWVSFNSTSGGGGIDYGVHVDPTTGVFSGFAWSEIIGWISFNESDLVGCPSGACQAKADLSCPGNQCLVSGWAKILANGNWLRLRGQAQDGSAYGVWLDKSLSPIEFKDYAWSDQFGWLSFNGPNYEVMTSLTVNQAPTAANLAVASPNPNDYAGLTYPPVRVSWQFSDPGDSQTAFQIQTSLVADFSSLAVDTGKKTSSSQSYVFSEQGFLLEFNKTYFWRLKVWDSFDANSNWVVGPSFTTPRHPYPFPDFEWSPLNPQIGETTQFCTLAQLPFCLQNKSICYNNSQQPISCSGSTFLWQVAVGNNFVEGTNASSANPRLDFYTASPVSVTLNLTDQDGYGPVTKTMNVVLKAQAPACGY